MADYQEYRRRILHRRWRRVFIIVALLALLALLSAIGILWKVLHRERVDTALSQNTILRQNCHRRLRCHHYRAFAVRENTDVH